jgi:hypothetical protein
MTLLPVARPLRAPDSRAWRTLLFLVVVYAITVLATPRWYPSYIVGTIFLTLALVWAPAGFSLARVRRLASRGRIAMVAAAIVLLAVVLGRAQEVQYYDHHYTEVDHFLQEGGPKAAYRFAIKQQNQRIGLAGSGEIFFGQYGYYGANLNNYVQYIGVGGPNGTWRLPSSCPQFRRLINAGHYDFLIMSQYTMDAAGPYQFPVYAWVKKDPAVEQIIAEPHVTPEPDYVFKVKGRLNPAGC